MSRCVEDCAVVVVYRTLRSSVVPDSVEDLIGGDLEIVPPRLKPIAVECEGLFVVLVG